jgi:pimeloyl-ACP methyl ester carboxylesterase
VTLPDQPGPREEIPLIVVIDPHGDGLTALQKFTDALEDLPVAIAASNKLRNNYPGFEISLEHLKNDLLTKYPVDPQRIIVAGFSGGARMAFHYGMKNPVQGIIMFGAGPGELMNRIQNKQIYAVSGTRDFNFIEQYRPLFTDIPNRSNDTNDYFRGTHSWPPERYIREAVVFCLRETSEPFRSLSMEFSSNFLRESDSLKSANDLLFSGKALEKAWYFTAGDQQKKILAGQIDAFKSNPEWIACRQKIETLLKSEESMKQFFAENLTDPDTAWWSEELNSLFTQIRDCNDPAEKDYYYRLKGFLGIYLYSQINTLLQDNSAGDLLDRLIRIYEKVEPDSEDLIKFKATRKAHG